MHKLGKGWPLRSRGLFLNHKCGGTKFWKKLKTAATPHDIRQDCIINIIWRIIKVFVSVDWTNRTHNHNGSVARVGPHHQCLRATLIPYSHSHSKPIVSHHPHPRIPAHVFFFSFCQNNNNNKKNLSCSFNFI